MAENLESVRLPAELLGTYRQWAESSGRTLSGLLTMVLRDAATTYHEGRMSAWREAKETVTAT